MNKNIFPKVIQLPEGHKDVDELANTDSAGEKMEHAFTQAQDGFVYIFETIKTTHDRGSPIGKQKVLQTMFEIIIHIDSMNIQIHYLQVLAESLGMSYEVLYPQYKKYAKGDGKMQVQRIQNKQNQSQQYTIQGELLLASLIHDHFMDNYDNTVEIRKPLKSLIQEFASFDSQSLLGLTYTGTNHDQDKQKLEETQLRWARELDSLNSEHKQYEHIIKTTKQYIQQARQRILKDPNTSHEKKQTIQKHIQHVFDKKEK